jgi:hypothetical protein
MIHDDEDQSDGIPKAPAPPAIRGTPTDRTIRAFSLTLPSGGVPTAAPTAATSAVDMPNFAEGTADGNVGTAAVVAAARAAVEAITADDPTGLVTPLDVGYRYIILRRVVELIVTGDGGDWRPLRAVNGVSPGAEVIVDPADHRVVLVIIRRWRDFAAWVRAHALDNFVAMKSVMDPWPGEIKNGARSVLRRLSEACHQRPACEPNGDVLLRL